MDLVSSSFSSPGSRADGVGEDNRGGGGGGGLVTAGDGGGGEGDFGGGVGGSLGLKRKFHYVGQAKIKERSVFVSYPAARGMRLVDLFDLTVQTLDLSFAKHVLL